MATEIAISRTAELTSVNNSDSCVVERVVVAVRFVSFTNCMIDISNPLLITQIPLFYCVKF